MGLTEFSFIMLPLTLLWLGQPFRLLQLTAAVGAFEAAAAVTFGGLGLQPALAPAFAFLGYVALQTILGARYPGRALAWRVCLPLTLVTLYALAGSFVLPRLFEGQAWVWPQKSLPPFVITQLAPSPTNLNQDAYLLANSALLLVASAYLTRTGLKLRRLLDAWFVSGFLAAGVAVWQLANRVVGVPYPTELFYSNPGWAILTAQNIGSIPRINGPFSEPSSLGAEMAALACAAGWMLLHGNRQRIVKALFLVSIGTCVLSTSTTGLVTLAGGGAAAACYALATRSREILRGLTRAALPTAALLAMLGLGAAAFAPALIGDVGQVFTATSTKQDSSSFQDRTGVDLDSIQAAVDTWGLGTGWGSNRSSSLVPGLLASVGLPGLVGVLCYAGRLSSIVGRARRSGCSADHAAVIDGCCGGLVGSVISALISAPAITSPIFFLLLALLTGCSVRALLDAGQRRGAARNQWSLQAAHPSYAAAAG